MRTKSILGWQIPSGVTSAGLCQAPSTPKIQGPKVSMETASPLAAGQPHSHKGGFVGTFPLVLGKADIERSGGMNGRVEVEGVAENH